jgi:CHASE2 domain-containing sensor protein
MISIDQKSTEQLGTRYPWSRTYDARLIEQLKKNGVGKIVFDIAFSGLALLFGLPLLLLIALATR